MSVLQLKHLKKPLKTKLIMLSGCLIFSPSVFAGLGDIGKGIEVLCGQCGLGQKADDIANQTAKPIATAVDTTVVQPFLKPAVALVNAVAAPALEEIKKGADKTVTELGNGVKDTVATLVTGQPQGDIAKTVSKAAVDIGKQAERDANNLADAAKASGHFIENQIEAERIALAAAERRIQEGKYLDALWHLQTDRFVHSNDNLAAAVTESSLLNNIAAAAASANLGPTGAAAYASWLTYNQTKDVELAVKAGVIAGATAKGLKTANGIDNMSMKVLTSASIAGIAVAASGGKENDIKEAVVKGAVFSLATEEYRSMVHQNLDGKAPTMDPVAKLDPKIQSQFQPLRDSSGMPIRNASGQTQIYIPSMPHQISMVGIATSNPNAGWATFEETSAPMKAFAKLPYANAMAYYHDAACDEYHIRGVAVPLTIIPATVLTVAATDTPIIVQGTKATIDSNKGAETALK